MAGFVDNEKYESGEDEDQSLVGDDDFEELDEINDEDTDQPKEKNISISRRRIEDYMELRRMRNELDDPFFDFD